MDNQKSSMLENVDCVTIGGNVYTLDNVMGRLENMRKRYFDLPLNAKPIVSESRFSRNADQLSAAEKEILDNAPYEFDESVGERRFRTEFDYYSALIRAAEDNADQIFQLKRMVVARLHIIQARYGDLYDMCLHDYGSQTMGKNANDRTSWFHMKYPALFEIERAYSDFLEEVDIELQRWEQFSASASRQLTATETSYKATGRLFDRRSGRYDVE